VVIESVGGTADTLTDAIAVVASLVVLAAVALAYALL
jgi:hypothetical protein